MSPELKHSLDDLNPTVQTIEQGEILFEEGTKPECLIFIEEGLVRLQKSNRSEETEFCLHRNFWGLREILSDASFPHTVIAEVTMSCWVIPREVILEKVKYDFSFRLQVMQQIAKDIEHKNHSFE